MSPRRNRARRDAAEGLDDARVRRGIESVQEWREGDWTVRTVPGGAATKAYRCPGCLHEIRPGTAHVVVWPADWRGDAGDRRHWHNGCWSSRDRRGPGGRNSW